MKSATLTLLVALAGPAFASAQDDKPLTEREAQRALELAEEKMEEGNPADAGGIYLRVLQDFPEMGEVRLKLARIYRDFGEWDNAANAYSEAVAHLEKPEEKAEAYEGMTAAYAKVANYPKVVEAGRQAIELSPTSADAHVNLALGLAKTGELEEAAQVARKALELAPTSAVAHATLGEAALADGSIEEAQSAFQKAVELDANNAEAHAGLAAIYFEQESYQDAADSATKALELNDQLTRAYGIRGMARNALGDANAAYSDLAMAITVNPNDPDANLAFAQVYQAQGNSTMAASYYQKAIDINPRLTDAYVSLAEIYVGQRKLQEVGTLMEKAVQHMPDNPQIHYYRGVAQDAAGDKEGALQSFSRAIELNDQLAGAHYGKGKILREQKQTAEAVAELEKAVELEGDDSEHLTQLGIAYYESQQFDKALSTLEKAVAAPDYANALGWAYLGVALKDKQRFAEAAQYFEKAVEAYPNYGLAHWGLGWSAFGQIEPGCPCGPEDEALVQTVIEHAKLAVEYGANDPALTERADVLARGEKVK